MDQVFELKVQQCIENNEDPFHRFGVLDKKADENELSAGLIKSAKRTGTLSLCNRGLGTVPENVWKIDELVLEESKEVDFSRPSTDSWWTTEPLKTLDLSSNVIKVISPNIKFLTELVTLRLHDNALTRLPDEIGELTNLTTLSLDHNKLEQLPASFYKLQELRWLSLSHNKLMKLDLAMGDLVMLTFLDMSHNSLVGLPPGLGYLVRLQELNLSYNHLPELPPDIVNMRELRKLNLSHNKLHSLPPLGELRRAMTMDFSFNELVTVPDVAGCTALAELHLNSNCIQEIDEEFCEHAQQLRVLVLRDNKLQALPDNVPLLAQLQRLDLTNNSLDQVPRNLHLLSQLRSLSLDGNRMKGVRSDVLKGGNERLVRFLRDRATQEVIAETRTDQDDWPDKFTMKRNQSLVISGRGINNIPERVLKTAGDAAVHVVDLSNNQLVSLPDGLEHVAETLSQLILSKNLLSSLDGAVGRCLHLQHLELANNRLADLPQELEELQHLRELDISHNTFEHLPRCVYNLSRLEILLVAHNQLTELDVSQDALGRLQSLAVLDLANNSIRSVPPELGNFTHLRSVELRGNCFRTPRHAILEKGTPSLLSYLRDRIPTTTTTPIS